MRESTPSLALAGERVQRILTSGIGYSDAGRHNGVRGADRNRDGHRRGQYLRVLCSEAGFFMTPRGG